MFEMIKPVLLTYATRRSVQWGIGLGGGFYLLIIFAMAMHDHSRYGEFRTGGGSGFIGAFASAFAAYLLVSQAKWQFVDPRARLLPGFARPHLLVLTALAVIGILLAPLLEAIAARLSVVGYLAFTTALASSFIWAMHANSGPGTMLSMLLGFSMMSERVRYFWVSPESVERFFPLHATVLLAGWAAIAAWLRRLVRMTEESDDYSIPIQAQSGSATRMERTQASRNILRSKLSNGLWNGGPSDGWHDRLIHYHARTIRDRQRLFRYGFAPQPFEYSVCWTALWMTTVTLLIRWQSSSADVALAFNAGSLAPFVFFPALMPGQFLAMRRARMTQELLFPLSRREFVDSVLLELARVLVLSFAVLGAVALLLVNVIPFAPFDFPISKVLAAFAMVAAVQPFFFAVNVYTALWNSALARLGIMMAAMMPLMAVTTGAILPLKYRGPTLTLGIAATVLPLGLWFVAKARHKWLNAELAT
jgi:hypothetical protein